MAGSSLGGWLGLQLALDHPEVVDGLVLIAPALDFTERLWARMSPQQQAAAQQDGRLPIASK
jgi:pimeloyl-ACP methyl ester carboxylesterase